MLCENYHYFWNIGVDMIENSRSFVKFLINGIGRSNFYSYSEMWKLLWLFCFIKLHVCEYTILQVIIGDFTIIIKIFRFTFIIGILQKSFLSHFHFILPRSLNLIDQWRKSEWEKPTLKSRTCASICRNQAKNRIPHDPHQT